MARSNIYSDKSFYNLIFVDLMILDREVVALFDTGASLSVIPESLAAELSLSVQGSVTARNNQGQALNLKRTILPRLTLGQCHKSDLECLVMDDAFFDLPSEDGTLFPAEMILGWNAIQDFYWACDLVKRSMAVAPGGRAPVSKSLDYEGFPLIPATFHGQKLKAGLDIGHTSTMIASKVQGLGDAEEIKTELVGLGTTTTVNVRTVSEFPVVIDGQPVVLKNVEVYPEIHGGNDLDVLFGADILEGCRWILDLKSECFKLEEAN